MCTLQHFVRYQASHLPLSQSNAGFLNTQAWCSFSLMHLVNGSGVSSRALLHSGEHALPLAPPQPPACAASALVVTHDTSPDMLDGPVRPMAGSRGLSDMSSPSRVHLRASHQGSPTLQALTWDNITDALTWRGRHGPWLPCMSHRPGYDRICWTKCSQACSRALHCHMLCAA